MSSHKSQQGFLNVKQVADLLVVAVSTIWLWVKEGKFPKPIKFGKRATRWSIEKVQGFVEQMEELNRDKDKGNVNNDGGGDK
jgi:prophage regulatory protein